MDKTGRGTRAQDGHVERGGDDLSREGVAHGPADAAAGADVERLKRER